METIVVVQSSSERPNNGLLPTLLEIGKKRAAKLAQMKAALERKDFQTVLELAHELCGLVNDGALYAFTQRTLLFVVGAHVVDFMGELTGRFDLLPWVSWLS